MNRFLVIVLALLIAIGGGLAASASGGADDGPYFVVDPLLEKGDNTTHVYTTLTDALTALDALQQEAWGATVILLPGEHVLPAGGAALSVPGLTIRSRDGADKTQITCSGTAIFVLERDISIESVKILGQDAAGAAVGIDITASGCTLQDVIVESWPAQGIKATNADGLTLDGVQILSCSGDGLNVAGTLGLVVGKSRFVANIGNGANIVACDGAVILDSEFASNRAGLVLSNCRNAEVSGLICSSNNDNGISIASCNWATATGNTCDSNGGSGISLFATLNSLVASNTLGRNTGGGIKAIDSIACAITDNDIGLNGGTPGSIPPAVPGIALEGSSLACKVERNKVANHAYGVALLAAGGNAPSGCTVSSNVLRNLTQVGLYVANSGGGNTLELNQIFSINQDGIRIDEGGDLVLQNTISDAGAYGINLRAADGVLLRENQVAACGRIGVMAVDSDAVRIEGNIVSECSEGGIAMANAESPVISGNEIRDHEGFGLKLESCDDAKLRWNSIKDNNQQGIIVMGCKDIDISPWNVVSTNRMGGIEVDAPSTGLIRANLIYMNLSFGVSTSNPKIDIGANWWGDSRGPAGLFAGRGNAVLGVAASRDFAAPLLAAPPLVNSGDEHLILADYTKAQVGFITTFASGKVTVNRLDTAGIRLAFTGVADRASAWVNTVPLDASVLSEAVDAQPAGNILVASAVLVAGINPEGAVEIAMTGGSIAIDSAKLYAYVGGQWEVDSSGQWSLVGGQWIEVSNCTYDGSSLVIGDVTVASLLGDTKVIALVKPGSQPE